MIQSSEILNNQIFEKVFLNDLPSLKKLVENVSTFFDKKKKLNIRDMFKRTVLFYSL